MPAPAECCGVAPSCFHQLEEAQAIPVAHRALPPLSRYPSIIFKFSNAPRIQVVRIDREILNEARWQPYLRGDKGLTKNAGHAAERGTRSLQMDLKWRATLSLIGSGGNLVDILPGQLHIGYEACLGAPRVRSSTAV
ncbi:uncharacterized protein VTP21DRAFT_1123 [Calcarisporiella thermophila]|uniref:uncharacterized protein n=1 Tax=Calcarisporiella thermophila TaxID=911321 RepID=UPI0037439EAF